MYNNYYNGGYYGNQYGNPYYNPYSQYPNAMNGYMLNPTMQPPKFTQPLTDAQIKELRNNGDSFSIMLSPIDVNKALCTHKYNHGMAVVEKPDGTFQCTICGATIIDKNYTEADVQAYVDEIINIMQLIKLYWVDVPEEVAREFYIIIGLISKIAKIYTIAANNYKNHAGSTYNYNAADNSGARTIQQFNALTNGNGFGLSGAYGYNAYAPQPQPMYAQPQQTYYGQQYQQNIQQPYPPQYGYQQAPQQPTMGVGMGMMDVAQQAPTGQFTNPYAGQPQNNPVINTNPFGYYSAAPTMPTQPQQPQTPPPVEPAKAQQPQPTPGQQVTTQKSFDV